ncbi:ATP-binding cassette domain-containing protein, partial [Ensifer adhaerens]
MPNHLTETPPIARDQAVVTLHDVSFAIGDRNLLHPLTLQIPAGHSIALIGHNGSGKSTLLKLIGRQLVPTSGRIDFEGKPLAGWGTRAFARRLGYLPQSTPPAPGMLARELVALGRYPWHGALGRFGSADRAKAEEAIEVTGIGPFVNREVDSLSG